MTYVAEKCLGAPSVAAEFLRRWVSPGSAASEGSRDPLPHRGARPGDQLHEPVPQRLASNPAREKERRGVGTLPDGGIPENEQTSQGGQHVGGDQRKLLAARIEEVLENHPLSKVLTSMPGIGVRTGARILIDVGNGSSFPSAAHLADYAGLAPATRSSGSSIRGKQPSRRKNKQLKRALFLSRSPTWPPAPTTTRRSARASTTPKPSEV